LAEFVLRLLFVFGMAVVTEMAYTSYAFYVSRVDTVKAPISSGLIGVFKAILVIAYVREPVMITALALGQVLGTWLTLRYLKSKARQAGG